MLFRLAQQSFEEWEDRTKQEMEQCCRYLDKLSVEERMRYDRDWVRSSMRTPAGDRPWNQVNLTALFDCKWWFVMEWLVLADELHSAARRR